MRKSPPNKNRYSTIHNSAAGTGHEKARTSRIVCCRAEARQQLINSEHVEGIFSRRLRKRIDHTS